jgi:hypothetical protein
MNIDTSSSIPMAEGYDGSIGCAKALIESAQNDYAMFRAMLESDAREIQAMKSGYVNESEIISLQEATIGGIWNKIKELFKKLIAKIKSIFANFLAKFRSLYMKDKDLVKTYGQQVMRKSNLGNMSIKWRKTKGGNGAKALDFITTSITDVDDFANKSLESVAYMWDDDADKRWEKVTETLDKSIKLGIKKASSASELRENVDEAIWEDDSPTEYDFKDIFSGAREMINTFESLDKMNKDSNKTVTKLTRALDKKLKDIDKFANDAAKDAKDYNKTKKFRGKSNYFDKDDLFIANDKGLGRNLWYDADSEGNDTNRSNKYDDLEKDTKIADDKKPQKAMDIRSKFANQTYDMCVVMNDAILVCCNVYLEAQKEFYKQTKAVFMKAVTVSDKKLEESSIYAQAVAEAAIHEIDTIF